MVSKKKFENKKLKKNKHISNYQNTKILTMVKKLLTSIPVKKMDNRKTRSTVAHEHRLIAARSKQGLNTNNNLLISEN